MSDFGQKVAFIKTLFQLCYSVKMTYFEFFLLLRKAWFWTRKDTMHQILNTYYHNASSLELKFWKRVGVPKKTCIQKFMYSTMVLHKTGIFLILLVFWKRKNLNSRKYNASDWYYKSSRRVWFFDENFLVRKILK